MLKAEAGGKNLPPAPIKDASGAVVLVRKHNTLPQLMEHGLISPRSGASWWWRAPRATRSTGWFPSTCAGCRLARKVAPATTRRTACASAVTRATRIREEFQRWLLDRYERRRRGLLGAILPAASRKHVDWLEGVDVVLRFERLQETFNELQKRVGIDPPLTIPLLNQTVSREERDYRPWYSQRARQAAERAFAAYNQRHGYAFE